MTKEDRIQSLLRVAVSGQDGESVVVLLSSTGLPPHRLQLAGTGVLIALSQHQAGAQQLAQRTLDALAERHWDGDEELATELKAALGAGPPPSLRPVPVQLAELADAMDTSDYGGRINLQDGEVWPAGILDYDVPEQLADEDFDDPDRWLGIDPSGSRVGWNDMSDFIETVTDPGRADRLSIAIEGRGAFRRFKDVLHRWPDELDRWYSFSEDRKLGRAREWLAGEGYRATAF